MVSDDLQFATETGPSDSALTRYFEFSERVDLFFEWNMTLSSHIRDLRKLYTDHPQLRIPDYNPKVEGRRDEIVWEMLFSIDFQTKFSALSMIDPTNPSLKSDSPDPVNFAFYTCYCFQWNLFETFVKDQIFGLCGTGILTEEQEKRFAAMGRNQTENLLKYLDSGALFGKTPFVNLFEQGLTSVNPEQVTYRDLDAIRVKRNKFVHGIESPEIIAATSEDKEAEYKRLHQILTQFAAQIDRGIRDLKRAKA